MTNTTKIASQFFGYVTNRMGDIESDTSKQSELNQFVYSKASDQVVVLTYNFLSYFLQQHDTQGLRVSLNILGGKDNITAALQNANSSDAAVVRDILVISGPDEWKGGLQTLILPSYVMNFDNSTVIESDMGNSNITALPTGGDTVTISGFDTGCNNLKDADQTAVRSCLEGTNKIFAFMRRSGALDASKELYSGMGNDVKAFYVNPTTESLKKITKNLKSCSVNLKKNMNTCQEGYVTKAAEVFQALLASVFENNEMLGINSCIKTSKDMSCWVSETYKKGVLVQCGGFGKMTIPADLICQVGSADVSNVLDKIKEIIMTQVVGGIPYVLGEGSC